jgi:hypothetical protein
VHQAAGELKQAPHRNINSPGGYPHGRVRAGRPGTHAPPEPARNPQGQKQYRDIEIELGRGFRAARSVTPEPGARRGPGAGTGAGVGQPGVGVGGSGVGGVGGGGVGGVVGGGGGGVGVGGVGGGGGVGVGVTGMGIGEVTSMIST